MSIPASGTSIASCVPFLSDTRPRRGAKSAPPDIPDARKEAPRFVCRPSPRRDREKIVGDMQAFAKNSRLSIAIPALPLAPTAAARDASVNVVAHMRIHRGLEYFMRMVTARRPSAKIA